MLNVIGNEIYRDEDKIGYLEGHHVYTHDGRKLGYFTDHHVWNESDQKQAYIEGDHLYSENGDTKIALEQISEAIHGGVLPTIARCAIYIFFGN